MSLRNYLAARKQIDQSARDETKQGALNDTFEELCDTVECSFYESLVHPDVDDQPLGLSQN